MDNEPQTQAITITRPISLGQMKELGRMAAVSHYFRTASTPEQAALIIKAGSELGIAEMAALQSIYFIDGRITLSSTLMAGLIQKSGRFSYRVRRKDAQACIIEFFEGAESLGVESFTLEEAKNAGLYPNKDNWKKYPKAMLFNRAMSNGAKTYCPAVFAGNPVYTPEEVNPDLTINPDTGEVIDGAYSVETTALATTQQKVEINQLARKAGVSLIDWLRAQEYPPVAQLTEAQAMDVLTALRAVLQPKTREDRAREIFADDPPSTASDAPLAPETIDDSLISVE